MATPSHAAGLTRPGRWRPVVIDVGLTALTFAATVAMLHSGRFEDDPRDVDAMAGTIRRLLEDPAGRDRLAERALRRSARFSWSSSARSLLDCFEELDPVRRPGRPTSRPKRNILRWPRTLRPNRRTTWVD